MSEIKSIKIPSSLLNFERSSGAIPPSPSNTRGALSVKLLRMIREGKEAIPETKDNASLVQWIQSKAKNNILHMIWYLQQATRENQPTRSSPVGKADIWASSSKL